jgi:hypothetical protein
MEDAMTSMLAEPCPYCWPQATTAESHRIDNLRGIIIRQMRCYGVDVHLFEAVKGVYQAHEVKISFMDGVVPSS